MPDEQSLLGSARGSLIAPAGCGKTELLARAVAQPAGLGSLVLTHTHAGVQAIRSRLRRFGVAYGRARVDTIASWCLRYSRAYAKSAQLTCLEPVRQEWESVYDGLLRLLQSTAIRSVIRATYARVLVDEYQDCTMRQHAVIQAIADLLPTYVLGDPLQGIFGFAGGNLSWTSDVEAFFPPVGTLTTPWRWKGKNEALGQWLLDLRKALLAGAPIDLAKSPVVWSLATPANQCAAAYALLKASGSVVAIRKWPQDAHDFARNLAGSYQSMEEVDCKDLLKFASDLQTLTGPRAAARIIDLAKDCFTEVGTALADVLKALDGGANLDPDRYPKRKPVVAALVNVTSTNDPEGILLAMQALEGLPDAKLFRRELWSEARRALTAFSAGGFANLWQAAWSIRNRHRATGREIAQRSVSRTLLVKGLEFDRALLVDAADFTQGKTPGEDARHFYVAATRASHALSVCATTQTLQFSAPKL